MFHRHFSFKLLIGVLSISGNKLFSLIDLKEHSFQKVQFVKTEYSGGILVLLYGEELGEESLQLGDRAKTDLLLATEYLVAPDYVLG